jgi:hypothetical protein
MKGLIDFAKLPLPQQARILWEQGNYLLSRQDESCTFSLYSLENFFVKVCTQETGTITQIIVVDSFIRRNASLQIDSLERSAA